jgi:hypothetical protein
MMAQNIFRYSRAWENCPQPTEGDYQFKSAWGADDVESLAEDAAADFHSEHDGWECTWPITFAIFSKDDVFIANVTVERDVEPVFNAYKVAASPLSDQEQK